MKQSEISIDSQKEILIYSLVANLFVRHFTNESNDGSGDSLNELKKLVTAVNTQNHNVQHGTGSSSHVDLAKRVTIDHLIAGYNSLLNDENSVSDLKLCANALDYRSKAEPSPENLFSYVKKYLIMKALFLQKFQTIQDVKLTLNEEIVLPDQFLQKKVPIHSYALELVGKIKVSSETSGKSKSARSNVNTKFKKSATKNEVYLAHHLDIHRNPVIAIVDIGWCGKEVVTAEFEQTAGFADNLLPIKLSLSENGTFFPLHEKIYFLVLEAKNGKKNPITYLQITFETETNTPSGAFSTVIIPKEKGKQLAPVPVSGSVIFQKVVDAKSAREIVALLLNPDYSNLPKLPDSYQIILKEVWSIRYRLINKISMIFPLNNEQHTIPWETIQGIAGVYIGYYMRLARPSVSFQTCLIWVYPDGTSEILQTDAEKESGYVISDKNKIWFYFGAKSNFEHAPVRLIFDKSLQSDHTMFGIFSSASLVDHGIASGKIVLRRLKDSTKHLLKPIPYKDVLPSDFKDKDLEFFTGFDSNFKDLTDGPFWAEVAHRNKHIVDILQRLGSKLGWQFYYYTFKHDNSEHNFIIERNLVTFFPDGSVEIEASDSVYKGHVYYLKKTLKLSLSNEQSGFLEIFLEFDNDTAAQDQTSEIKILYGMSLWHSNHRLQAKTVVLSRYHGKKFSTEAEIYKFSPGYRDALEREDRVGGGVISYLRGTTNRYMHATANHSSPIQFRPRDRRFREMHFLIATFYGYRIQNDKSGDITTMVEECQYHIEQAYIHGYGCNFGNFIIDPNSDYENDELLRGQYIKKFYKTLENIKWSSPSMDKKTKDRIMEVVGRFKEIAKEKIFLKEVTSEEGPLSHPDIKAFMYSFWPWLKKKK